MTGFIKIPTQEHIDAQYKRVLTIIEETFEPDRVDALMCMYEELQEQIKEAPASAKVHYHNAYPGGYLDHVLHVHDIALRMAGLYLNPVTGGVQDFTKQELVFSALHHDLGKVGDEEGPNYVIEEDNFWIRKGSTYKYNDEHRQYMTVYDRTMYLLQKYGVTVTRTEMLTIKMTDGLFDEGNKKYYMAPQKYAMRSALPYIMHWSDHMATIAEKNEAFHHEHGN